MQILFLDDSYQKTPKYYGLGGYCIDEKNVRPLISDISQLKKKFKIPEYVWLKWSPSKKHPIHRCIKGSRQTLNKEALELLKKYEATTICHVFDLREHIILKNSEGDFYNAKLSATKILFKWICERFEKPYLNSKTDTGIIIADQYEGRTGEKEIMSNINWQIANGTEFQKFKKISLIPMMTASKYCPPLQLADLVTGIVVASLANSKYALELLEDVALLFLRRPSIVKSTCSYAVMGVGFKLYPNKLIEKGNQLLQDIDHKYIFTRDGVEPK
ncbi:MAG: DUF3800 domain-containing protein [bacterium]